MHELSIATALVEQIENILSENTGKLVSFTLELGALSGVDKDALELALPFAMQTSSFKDARAIINEIKIKISCKKCKNIFSPINKFIMICPLCDSTDVLILEGKKFTLKSIELNQG